jgi:alanine dehydrogenase
MRWRWPDGGPHQALLDNPNFREGLNVYQGKVTHKAVVSDLGYDFVEPTEALSA